jgi:hypothetical protein
MEYDDWLVYREHEYREEEFECPECGTSVNEEGKYCSNSCWNASWI